MENSILQNKIYFNCIKMKNDPINWSHNGKLHVNFFYLLRVLFVSSSSCSMNYLSYSCPYFSNVLTFCICFMMKFFLMSFSISNFLFLSVYGFSFQLFSSDSVVNSILMNILLQKFSSTLHIQNLTPLKIVDAGKYAQFSIKIIQFFNLLSPNLKILLLQMAYTLNSLYKYKHIHMYLCTLPIFSVLYIF